MFIFPANDLICSVWVLAFRERHETITKDHVLTHNAMKFPTPAFSRCESTKRLKSITMTIELGHELLAPAFP